MDFFSQLVDACKTPDTTCLRRLLQDPNVKVNMTCPFTGQYALHVAIDNGFFDSVRLLVEHRANIEIRNQLSRTPLANAMSRYDERIATYLVERGANTNAVCDNKSITPLMIAVSRSAFSLRFIQLLLDHRAWLHDRSEAGMTPLAYALRYRPGTQEHIVNVVQLLLDRGAIVNELAFSDATPVQYVLEHEYCDALVDVLLPRMPRVDGAIDKYKRSALMIAVDANCSSHAMDALFQRGVNVNYMRISDGSSALSLAVAKNRPMHVKWLLEHGGIINYPSCGLKMMRFCASRIHSADTPLLLLRHWRSVDEVQPDGDKVDTLLDLAKRSCNNTFVEFYRTYEYSLKCNRQLYESSSEFKMLPPKFCERAFTLECLWSSAVRKGDSPLTSMPFEMLREVLQQLFLEYKFG